LLGGKSLGQAAASENSTAAAQSLVDTGFGIAQPAVAQHSARRGQTCQRDAAQTAAEEIPPGLGDSVP